MYVYMCTVQIYICTYMLVEQWFGQSSLYPHTILPSSDWMDRSLYGSSPVLVEV